MKPDHGREPPPGTSARTAGSALLTRFEAQCLRRRTRECEEALQLAVLGVESACQGQRPDACLDAIADHLREAERHAEIARQLASRWSA